MLQQIATAGIRLGHVTNDVIVTYRKLPDDALSVDVNKCGDINGWCHQTAIRPFTRPFL